jgi:formylglycine-generating enzyme
MPGARRNPCYFTDGARTTVFAHGETSFTNEMVDWAANGYRLPTEAEWEGRPRGGLEGKLFPWGDTITHSEANHYSSIDREYDISPTRGYHPDYITGSGAPRLRSPVGSFPANAYGLFDMAGNVYEWCWDVYETDYYLSSPPENPRGPFSGRFRVERGGSWIPIPAAFCRVAVRSWDDPFGRRSDLGFRTAKSR